MPDTPSRLPDSPTRRSRRAATLDDFWDTQELDPSLESVVDGSGPRKRRRVWPWIILAVFVAAAVAAGVVAFQLLSEVRTAQNALERAKADLSSLTTGLGEKDPETIQATADDISANVTLAADIVERPLWDIAAKVPFVGQNVDAVQRVTRAVDILVQKALPPGLQFMTAVDLDGLTVEGGGLNLEPFRQVQGSIPEIRAAFAAAKDVIAPLQAESLLPQVAQPVDEITAVIDQATPALGVAEKYLPTLLDIAGADGKKTYLVIFQNNAEIRATGGNPAASMILTFTDGKLGYADQASSTTFYQAGVAGNVYVPLPAETTGLYLPTLNRYSQDYTFTPDFPTTATLFQAVWDATSGASFDGVISIDPVVLSHMLGVAGPVKLATGETLTADNAVRMLLSQSYERYPDARSSDLFFEGAAKSVFDHLTSSSWDPMQMLAALQRSAEEQRVYLAFTDPEAQALAAEFGVDGALAPDTTTQTQVGVYLNNSSVSKLDYHLTSAVSASCDAASRTMTTTMTLHNGITDDIRSNYTLGWRNGRFGLPRTTLMLDVLFFAPPGASITQTTPATGDAPVWDRAGREKGNTAVSRTVFVPKGETVTVSATIKLPEGDLGPLNLRHTPTARDTAVTIDSGCDALFASK